MGAGASKEGEEIEVDERYVSQSQSGSASGPTSPRPRSERKSVGQARKASRMSMSRNAEGQEEVVIAVTRNGFSVPEVTVMEGQSVIFVWQEERMDVVQDHHQTVKQFGSRSRRHSVGLHLGSNCLQKAFGRRQNYPLACKELKQVIHDGEKLRPVIGGFSGNYNNTNGQYEQQFNLEGEYKFALSGVRCTPLLITVRRRVDIIAEVTDTGFQPDVIFIDQGHSIKWQWKQCSSPHSVQEVKYEINRACFKRDPDNAGNIKTVSGSYRHQFPRPGLYFFMTEGSELGRRHFCAVQVRETQREYKVEILDRSYQPMILLIEEGDRVWWNWDKQKCKKHHSIYQIEAPALNQGDDDPYVPVKDGFRWTTPRNTIRMSNVLDLDQARHTIGPDVVPNCLQRLSADDTNSKQGLMSYEFFKPGVYYFSDQNFQEAAEYIGTVIVKPKQKELFVELTETGFNPDLAYAQTGDRIWWTWDGPACLNSRPPQLFALMETEACLNPTSRKSSGKEGEEEYQYLDDESLAVVTKAGLATTHFSTIGVYHYRVAESPDSLNTCSVIVNPGPKNHTIHLTDNGFEPKVITVRPNDRVWWVWQSGKKQHNILQVSHQGVPIENGFCSGSPRDAPSAFMHQFMTPGVFYFMSHSLPKLFGAIVVSTQPQVHEVNVGVEIKPDPVTVKLNDIVCWIFRSLRQYNVQWVESIDQVVANEIENLTVPPRRCMSKAIMRPGVHHYYSKSFTKGKKEKENYIDDIKISSVVCDERYDNAVVRVDKNGFHPAVYYIQKSQSVMWVWKGSEDEAHNIIHVKSPDSDEPLNVIHGAKSFNSGKPVPNNSFLYTFDEDGSYTVASQGAPGFFCTVVVLDVGMRVKDPFLDSSVTGGTIDAGTKVILSCDTPGSRIFYTTDGSPPELHQETVRVYKPETGILLRRGGLAFVRAMATKEGRLNSHIYTSNRFWVMGGVEDDRQSLTSEQSSRAIKQSQRSSAKTWDWWGCIPSAKACFTNPGTLEVFWDPPEPGHLALIKGYQLFLNGVSYCDMFPPTNNSLCVSGMAGGRMYDVQVEVYPKKPDCQAQKSNKLRMKCPLITADGGPVISLERNDKNDTLAIVWMSIDSPQNPISGYLVFLNDQQCGKRLVPDPESNRCKVVIGSCELDKPYKVYVVAIPADSEHVLMSNVLEVVLPLDASEIRLPPRGSRSDEEELYLEYLEVNEGSGYLSAMDTEPRVYSAKRDHSFITESIESERGDSRLPAVPLSPVLAKREKTPLLPKDSRPPPVIYDAATGDEQLQRRPGHVVDEARYRADGVVPLRKESAKFRSKSFEEDESGRQSYERISSGISSYIARQRSRSHSPTQHGDPQETKTGRKLGLKGLAKVIGLAGPRAQKVPNIDLTEQTRRRALTFKTVCKAIIGFIRQEKILRIAVGPVKLQQPNRYDLRRLKTFVDRTKAFTDGLAKTKATEIIAPGATNKGKGMAGLFGLAMNVQQLKKLNTASTRKGGFVKQNTQEQTTAAVRHQEPATPGSGSAGRSSQPARPTRDEGYSSTHDQERDRRVPPEYRGDGFPRDPRDPRDRFFRDYPYHGRYTPPWEMRYREDYDEYLRRERDLGYDTMRSRDRRAVDEYYRREMDSDRDREYYRRKLAEDDYEDVEMEYSKMPHGERYKLPPAEYTRSRRRSMRSPDGYQRERSYSPAEDRSLRFQDSSPEDTQRSRREREGDGIDTRTGYRSQRDGYRSQKSPEEFSRKEKRRHSEIRMSSPGYDRERNLKTPEEYRWGRGKETKGRPSPRHMQALRYSQSFDRNRGDSRRYQQTREEAARMRAIAVYAEAMGGVNDDGDQSVMTDDNEKTTQTSSQSGQRPRFKPQLGHDFIPPSLQDKGISPRARRRLPSESETETETETESETESETDEYGQSQSMVVMDARKPQAPNLAVRKQKTPRTPRTPTTPKTPKSGREFETPRQRGVSIVRNGREYVEVEDDGTTSTDREVVAPHPGASMSFEKPRKRRRNMAIIEVQDAVELDAKRNETSMEEERQVAVPAVTKDSMRQIDEGQFITSDGDGILPAASIMVESHGKSGVRVIWDLPRQPDPEYRLLLYVVNVVGTRFTGDINSDISFECNIVEKGKQVRGVQHCWNIQDKNKCTVMGLVPGLTYRLYVITNYTLVHGQQPCEIQTTSSVIYYTTVGPPRPPKLRVMSVDMHQALLEWEPPRLHEDLQLRGYQIYVDNKPLGAIRNKETRQMMINNLVPGKTLSVYVVAVTKQANQESDPSRVIHITCPRQPPGITVAQQPAYKQGCVLISWDRPQGHNYATNEEDISLYGDKRTGTKGDNGTGQVKSNTYDKKRQQYVTGDSESEEAIEIGPNGVVDGRGYQRGKGGKTKGGLKGNGTFDKIRQQYIVNENDSDEAVEIGSRGMIDGHVYRKKFIGKGKKDSQGTQNNNEIRQQYTYGESESDEAIEIDAKGVTDGHGYRKRKGKTIKRGLKGTKHYDKIKQQYVNGNSESEDTIEIDSKGMVDGHGFSEKKIRQSKDGLMGNKGYEKLSQQYDARENDSEKAIEINGRGRVDGHGYNRRKGRKSKDGLKRTKYFDEKTQQYVYADSESDEAIEIGPKGVVDGRGYHVKRGGKSKDGYKRTKYFDEKTQQYVYADSDSEEAIEIDGRGRVDGHGYNRRKGRKSKDGLKRTKYFDEKTQQYVYADSESDEAIEIGPKGVFDGRGYRAKKGGKSKDGSKRTKDFDEKTQQYVYADSESDEAIEIGPKGVVDGRGYPVKRGRKSKDGVRKPKYFDEKTQQYVYADSESDEAIEIGLKGVVDGRGYHVKRRGKSKDGLRKPKYFDEKTQQYVYADNESDEAIEVGPKGVVDGRGYHVKRRGKSKDGLRKPKYFDEKTQQYVYADSESDEAIEIGSKGVVDGKGYHVKRGGKSKDGYKRTKYFDEKTQQYVYADSESDETIEIGPKGVVDGQGYHVQRGGKSKDGLKRAKYFDDKTQQFVYADSESDEAIEIGPKGVVDGRGYHVKRGRKSKDGLRKPKYFDEKTQQFVYADSGSDEVVEIGPEGAVDGRGYPVKRRGKSKDGLRKPKYFDEKTQQYVYADSESDEATEIGPKGAVDGRGFHVQKGRKFKDGLKRNKYFDEKTQQFVYADSESDENDPQGVVDGRGYYQPRKVGKRKDGFKRTKVKGHRGKSKDTGGKGLERHGYHKKKIRQRKGSLKGVEAKDYKGRSIVSRKNEGPGYYEDERRLKETEKIGGQGYHEKRSEEYNDGLKGNQYYGESIEMESGGAEGHGYRERRTVESKDGLKGNKYYGELIERESGGMEGNTNIDENVKEKQGGFKQYRDKDIDFKGKQEHLRDNVNKDKDSEANKGSQRKRYRDNSSQNSSVSSNKASESSTDSDNTGSKGTEDSMQKNTEEGYEHRGSKNKLHSKVKNGQMEQAIEDESKDIEGHGYHEKRKKGTNRESQEDDKEMNADDVEIYGYKKHRDRKHRKKKSGQSQTDDNGNLKDKGKRKKDKKAKKGNFFEGSSSESTSSSSSSSSSGSSSDSSSQSDSDDNEDLNVDSRPNIITVERDDDESDDLKQSKSQSKVSYPDRYKSKDVKFKDSEKMSANDLREIEEFKTSNIDDIGCLLNWMKTVESYRNKETNLSDAPPDNKLPDTKGKSFKGDNLTDLRRDKKYDHKKVLKGADTMPSKKQFGKDTNDEAFLRRLVDTDSEFSTLASTGVYKISDNASDSASRSKYFKRNKSLTKDRSMKDLRRKSTGGIWQPKKHVVRSVVDCGQKNMKKEFKGSRKSLRGKKGKSFRGFTGKDFRGNMENADDVSNFGNQYQHTFRGINLQDFSGAKRDAGYMKNGNRDHTADERGGQNENQRIYVDGKWYGEVKSNKLGNKHGYQYVLNDLNPEQSYDINVKAIAGYKTVDPEAQHLFCLSDGPMSNTLPVMAPAAPKSPKLRLEGLHPEGIDVTWLAPQQHGEAAISGYQMLKNGRLYGSIIPPEVNSLRIRDVSLGEKITLQLIALTEHPVGKIDRRTELLEKDSGIDGLGPGEKETDIFIGEKYAGCRPGAKLVVHYTGLVCPPSQVWCEKVTGHSALIVWNKGDEPKAHFIRPESYQVTWWPGDHPESDIQSDSTSEDHLLITNLRPAIPYTVVVEARKMEKYKDVDEESSVGHETVSAFILTAKSDNLVIKTAKPPDPPSNLGVLATTCNAIKLAWYQPIEHGIDVMCIRIDAVSLNTGEPHHVSLDVIPDATQATIEGLREKTDYMIRVTAITDEYFDRLPDRHRLKQARTIPKDTILPADDSPWLPNCSLITKTSGTEPPAALKVAKASTTSLKLVWTPPIVYGSNKLQSVIVRWADVKYNKRKNDDDFVVASHVNLLPTEDTLVIEDLMPGNQYKIIAEAVVSVKTSLEKDDSASGVEKYRRTAHIMSRPLYARTRAPTEPPVLLITGYTQTTAQLYWEKPLLMSVVGKDAEGKAKYLRRYLEGYKLEINGKTYCHLGPASQSCQLTKCKPGKLYHVTLVALTCTEQGKKERKRKYKGAFKNTNPQDLDYGLLLEDEDNLDSSPSEPLEITLPKNQDGYVASLDSFFTHNEDRDNKTFGDVKAQWATQGPENSLIKQYNIIWYSHDDRVVQTKYVSPDFNKCAIPVTRLKSIYDIVMEPVYFTETLPQQPQNIQIMIPGPPDPPEIFLKSSSPEEFVIEWGEPRLFGGVKVRGYQVFMNDKKAGNELSSTHRKAVIPCRPNRFYKVNLVALSSNPEYHDSGKSNTLSINTSLTSPREGEALDELTFADDQEVPVKVTKVTETSIHLDWVNFLEVDGVGCYKIQWSSVAQPAEREVRLSNKDTNCVINKCLPGTTHFVRLLALDGDGQIKDRSKQLTVQTSAPPDGPNLSLRACNFRYIAVQWDKPNTYGDALITGYKVYINGIVESLLNADQLSYTYTHGKWCQEYSFQVQALTSFEKMNSKPSEPLVVEWPGAKPPSICRLPTHTSSNLRVGWDDPYLTEGVKLKHFRVCCIEEDTEKMVSSIGPVHPDTREAEFKQIKKGSYNVYVEVHLYGTSEVVCSDPIKLQPAPAPDPPRIAATVVGFDERRLIEKITCDLVNKRDRLIRQVGHKLKQIGALTHPLRAEKDRDVIEGAHTLTRVEELLEDCFSALENYTGARASSTSVGPLPGQLMAHVSWQCEQSNPDIQVSGYKVLIDGKQYGNAMHEGVKTVRIKLGTEQQVFRLSMVSLTDKPSAASEESNIIDLLSETFRCFSFYCYHSIHTKGTCWPDQGCCKYQDAIAYERQLAKKLANQGLLKKHVPPPSCSLLDVFDGEYKPLLQSHNRQYPTVILFWTPWCLPSQKVMTYFTRFARETTKEYNFVAVACGMTSTSAAERKGLIHMITANSWREDGTITHYTSQCASSIYEATNHIWKNTTGGIKRDPDIETDSNVDLTDLLGIAGVPTFLFIHQEGYIAWHGRYSAYDYGSFSAFMRHTFSEVVAVPCPVFKCDSCKNDMSVDDETVETILQFTNNQSPFKNTIIRPAVIRPPSPKQEDDIDKLFVKRKHSPKRKQKNKLTVNQRPYSAHTTTYAYLLKSPYMERLTPSPKTHKVLMRPASSRNVQVAYETL